MIKISCCNKQLDSTLQSQPKYITKMQSSSQQISATPVIKSIQSVSGVKLVKQLSTRFACENIEETPSSIREGK